MAPSRAEYRLHTPHPGTEEKYKFSWVVVPSLSYCELIWGFPQGVLASWGIVPKMSDR